LGLGRVFEDRGANLGLRLMTEPTLSLRIFGEVRCRAESESCPSSLVDCPACPFSGLDTVSGALPSGMITTDGRPGFIELLVSIRTGLILLSVVPSGRLDSPRSRGGRGGSFPDPIGLGLVSVAP
jgi:hypothetical protein